MDKKKILRLIEWDLLPINAQHKNSLFDHLGERPLLILFFEIAEELDGHPSVSMAKKICLENPTINVLGIIAKGQNEKFNKQELNFKVNSLNVNFPVYFDSSGKTQDLYQIPSAPYWIISDKAGRIVSRNAGSTFKTLNLLNSELLSSEYLH